MKQFKLYLSGLQRPDFKLETVVSAMDRAHAMRIAARNYGWLKLDDCVEVEEDG